MEMLCTPKRVRRSLVPLETRAERRKSLFGVSGVSPLSSPDMTVTKAGFPSPTSSVGSPTKSPSAFAKTPVKALQTNFTQMALTRTPEKRIGIVSSRRSPRIFGVRRLSPDRGIISPKTFYGKKSLSMSDGKLLYQTIRDRVRVRLPMEIISLEKKRARSSDSLSKRPKKIPRYRLFSEDEKKDSTKSAKKKNRERPSSEKKNREQKQERKDKQSYNWMFFNSKTPTARTVSRLFGDKSPSVLTPPPTAKKRKLISSFDMDHLPGEDETPVKTALCPPDMDLATAIANDFSEDEDEAIREEKDVDKLINDLSRDVAEVLGDDVLATDLKETSETNCETTNREDEREKLYPLFKKINRNSPTDSSPQTRPGLNGTKVIRPKTDKNQLILDVGQSNLKEVICTTCGLFYVQGDDQDEAVHTSHHAAYKALLFTSWKSMRCVTRIGFDEIFLVKSGDPKACWSKAREVLDVADRELGYPQEWDSPSQVYMYVKKKRIIGCIAARALSNAHRLLPNLGTDVELCTEEKFPVRVGISRIWVHTEHRRQGIASQLVESLRRNYAFGEILKLDDIAFSAPTEDGKRFASNYCKRQDYLIYTYVGSDAS